MCTQNCFMSIKCVNFFFGNSEKKNYGKSEKKEKNHIAFRLRLCLCVFLSKTDIIIVEQMQTFRASEQTVSCLRAHIMWQICRHQSPQYIDVECIDDRFLAHGKIGVGILSFFTFRILKCCHRNMFSRILHLIHQINDVIPMKIFFKICFSLLLVRVYVYSLWWQIGNRTD